VLRYESIRACSAISGIAIAIAIAIAVALAPGLASAGTARIRFIPSPDADVIGYRLYLAASPQAVASASPRWLFPVMAGSDGNLAADIAVPAGTSWVGLRAWDGTHDSVLSNVIAVDGEPPVVGALLQQDFSGVANGSMAPGFWLFDKNGAPVAPRPGAFRVISAPSIQVLAETTGEALRAVYLGGVLNSWAGYELRGRMRLDGSGGTIASSVLGDIAGRGGYSLVMLANPQGGLAIISSPQGRCQGQILLPTAPRTGVWYRFALSAEPSGPSTLVRAKLWVDGTPEPADQASCLDSSLAAPQTGTIALYRSSGADVGAAYWDDLLVLPLFEGTCIEAQSCDDGDPNTVGDVCRGGRCQGSPCFADGDCDDGDECNGSERCVSGICRTPAFPVYCGYVSLELDGASWLATSGPAALRLGNSWSISLWVKVLDLSRSAQYLLSLGNRGGFDHSVSLSAWGPRGDLVLIAQGQGEAKRYIYPAALAQDRWLHVTATWNGTSLRTYVGGTERVPTVISDLALAMADVPRELAVGTNLWSPGVEAVARLGHLAIWNRALSASEVLGVRDAAHEVDLRMEDVGQGLVHYYRIGEDTAALGWDQGALPVHLAPVGLDPSAVILDAP
jgi:hypothetical protein